MPGALTLADVFNAEAAEAPYQRLVVVLNRQETLLERLNERLDAVEAAQEAAARSTRELEARSIAPLANRVSVLESETKREREALAVECRAQVEGLENALQLKCDHQELTDAIERAERATLKLGLEIRSEAASYELVNSLQVDQNLLHERLGTIDRRLDGKIDKTEASRMDAALTQIREFRPIAAQLTARVQDLETEQSRLVQSVHTNSTQLEGHVAELARLGENVNSNRRQTAALEREVHDDLVPQLRGSVQVLTRLEEGVSKCEVLASTLETALRTLSAKFHAHAASSADSARQVSARIKVTRDELAELRDQARQKWLDTARAIEKNAGNEALSELRGQVERLADTSESLERHAALSARFLDWFATRGEAHEHNLRLVETQLGRIALGSDPRRREPFSGSVRFPRSS